MGKRGILKLTTCLIVALSASACKAPTFLDRATVQFNPDDQSLKVSLVFGTPLHSTLSKLWEVPAYGALFVTPYAGDAKPLEMGFDLKLSIFDEKKFLAAAPTDALPNGLPLGLTHKLVSYRDHDAPQDPNLDLVGYVDVLHAKWLGMAAEFHFVSDEYFQPGTRLTQHFLQNAYSEPGVIAHVYGPTLNPDGSLQRKGGVAIFADVPLLTSDENASDQVLLPAENSGQAP